MASFSRVEHIAKQALEIAQYLYNDKTYEYVKIFDLSQNTACELSFKCVGNLDIEVLALGNASNYSIYVDDEKTDDVAKKIFQKRLSGLGRSKHIFKLVANTDMTDIKLTLKSKGGLEL